VDERPGDVPRLKRWAQWLTFGIGVKRWLVLIVLGALCGGVGALLAGAYAAVEWSVGLVEWFSLQTGRLLNTEAVGIILLTVGVVATLLGARGAMKAVESAYAKTGQAKQDFLGTALQSRELAGSAKIVAIGGGTGAFDDAARLEEVLLQHHCDRDDG
jgi:hypothetical protein